MRKLIIMTIAAVTLLSSCDTYTGQGAAFGSIIGSAVGGLAGGPRGSDIGTLVGMADSRDTTTRATVYTTTADMSRREYQHNNTTRRPHASEDITRMWRTNTTAARRDISWSVTRKALQGQTTIRPSTTRMCQSTTAHHSMTTVSR